MKSLPSHLVAYKRTPEFTQDTVPNGLLSAHRTKVGAWGKIVVLSGQLTYRILEPEVEEIPLGPGVEGIVEPTVSHEVVPQPGVRFYVEFYHAAEPRDAPGSA